MQKALAAFDRSDLGKAAGEARKAKEAAPRSPSVREALGLIYYTRKDYKGALAELQAFRRISGSVLQNPAIADCYRALGRADKALEVLAEIQRDQIDSRAWADAQITRARAHEDRGNYDAAIGVLRAADADPRISEATHLRVRYELADLLARRGQREEARALFARVAVKAPAYRDALERAR